MSVFSIATMYGQPLISQPTFRFSTLDRVIGYQTALREIGKTLRPSEAVVYYALIDMTMGYGKTRAKACYAYLAERVNVSRATIIRAVRKLARRGLIDIYFDGDRNAYDVDMEVLGMSRVKVPKTEQPGGKRYQEDAAEGYQNDTPGVSNCNPPLDTESMQSLRENLRKPSGYISPNNPEPEPEPEEGDLDDPREAARREAKKGKKVREKNLTSRIAGKGTLAGLMSVAWVTAHHSHDAGIPMGWLKKEGAMAKDMCKIFPGDRKELADFVDYVVGGWTRIMADTFGWANKTPSQPSLGFLRLHMERFLDAWAKVRRGGGPGSIEQLLIEGRAEEAAALMRKRG